MEGDRTEGARRSRGNKYRSIEEGVAERGEGTTEISNKGSSVGVFDIWAEVLHRPYNR